MTERQSVRPKMREVFVPTSTRECMAHAVLGAIGDLVGIVSGADQSRQQIAEKMRHPQEALREVNDLMVVVDHEDSANIFDIHVNDGYTIKHGDLRGTRMDELSRLAWNAMNQPEEHVITIHMVKVPMKDLCYPARLACDSSDEFTEEDNEYFDRTGHWPDDKQRLLLRKFMETVAPDGPRVIHLSNVRHSSPIDQPVSDEPEGVGNENR